MKTIHVKFPSGDLALEGELLLPDGEGPFPAAVVSHPYPPGGGSMQSSVVTAIWQALAERSVIALKYNFRGVGASEGSFDDGIGEREDVIAAFKFLLSQEKVDREKAGLVGYSFGSMMSALVAMKDGRVRGLTLVSAPLSEGQWQKLDGYTNPYIVMIGENDQMVPLARFRSRMDNPPNAGNYQLLAGADHFLAGHEVEVGSLVADFFSDIFFV